MGGLMATGTPYLINVCTINNFNIMILFAILSALSICLSYQLPETMNEPITDVIEELVQQIRSRSRKRIETMKINPKELTKIINL
jgi:hypothetical protein